MFRKGGSANEGIMHGLEDRSGYAGGGTIGGGNIQGTPMGYRTGFQDPTWDSMTPTDWEDIARTYGMSGAVSTDYTDPENIEKWSQPINYDFFNWLASDKVKAKEEKIKQEQIKALQNINAAKLEGIKTSGEQLPLWKKQGFESYADWLAVQGSGSGKGTGDLDDISVSDLNKERMKIFAPHMQKRMINDALAAASEKFGESTGDWKQDAASAISAAAKAMGGTQDIYDKVSMMTLAGEIQKDIEKSKEKRLGNYEFLYDKMMSPNAKDRKFAKSILKQDKDLGDFVEQHGTSTGYRLFVGKTMPNIKGTFAGDERSLKKLKTEDLSDGKYYLGPPADEFIIIEGGKITKREPGLV